MDFAKRREEIRAAVEAAARGSARRGQGSGGTWADSPAFQAALAADVEARLHREAMALEGIACSCVGDHVPSGLNGRGQA